MNWAQDGVDETRRLALVDFHANAAAAARRSREMPSKNSTPMNHQLLWLRAANTNR